MNLVGASAGAKQRLSQLQFNGRSNLCHRNLVRAKPKQVHRVGRLRPKAAFVTSTATLKRFGSWAERADGKIATALSKRRHFPQT
jgi:hypothetical protein